MYAYKVFDGVFFLFNDMHLEEVYSYFELGHKLNFLSIGHCKEGTMETRLRNDKSYFLQEDQVIVDNRKNHYGKFIFPLKHYIGISININLDQATRGIGQYFKGFDIDLNNLVEKYCGREDFHIIRNDLALSQLLSNIYLVPEEIRIDYYRVKVLELILYLQALHIGGEEDKQAYFYSSQVEKIKSIHDLITSDLQRHYTLADLSEKYEISLTSLKKCFRAVYGDSPYSYLRRYRINTAARLLIDQPDKTIAEIGWSVGYRSPSKFSSVFKKIIGQSPSHYRGLYSNSNI